MSFRDKKQTGFFLEDVEPRVIPYGKKAYTVPKSKWDNHPLAFFPSPLVGLALPARRTDERSFIRQTVRGSMVLNAGHLPDARTGEIIPVKMPSGLMARQALVSLVTMSVKQQKADVELDGTFTEWLRSMGFRSTGANLRKFRTELAALGLCSLQIFQKNGKNYQVFNGCLFKGLNLSLDETRVQPSLFPTQISFDDDFYAHIIQKAMPFPREALLSLRSALSFDLYCLAAKICFTVPKGERLVLSYADLQERIGNTDTNVHRFAAAVRHTLNKHILPAYDNARIDILPKQGLAFHHSRPPVLKRGLKSGDVVFF